MPVLPYILATAGHVDHGKSALVEALTGTHPDRLPEEKARGITIDLGFAHLQLPSPAAPDTTFQVGIIDVPGHEDFVRNMVAGIGSIDLALLVVAADDGWMPQTEEHLHILIYLGVTRAAVAITKADLVADTAPVRAAVAAQLAGTPFADAPIVITSAATGTGLADLKTALARILAAIPPQPDIGKPRLPVDRAFGLHGAGTIVTGTLTGGTLAKGQTALVEPAGHPVRIRALQTHNRALDVGLPGSRVALNLPDLALAPAAGPAVARGDVVTLPDLGLPCDTLDALIYRLDRPISPAAPRLKEGLRVHVHHGAAAHAATLHFLEGDLPAPDGRALAQLRFDAPIFAFAGDRLVLRDWPARHTLAGGLVLDPDARRRGFRTPARRDFLAARAAAPDDPRAFIASYLHFHGSAPRAGLLRKSRFSDARIAEAAAALVASGAAVAAGDLLFDASAWSSLLRRATEIIDTFHRAHPEKPGLPLADLRQAIPEPAAFDTLLAALTREDFLCAGALIRRRTHAPALPPHLQAAGTRLRAALASSKPFDPPSRGDLAPDPASRSALKFLIDTGEVTEIAPEIVLTAENYRRAGDAVAAYLRAHQAATVSQLKAALNSSRRVMVPLLERLDRDGLTHRTGDLRTLRPPR